MPPVNSCTTGHHQPVSRSLSFEPLPGRGPASPKDTIALMMTGRDGIDPAEERAIQTRDRHAYRAAQVAVGPNAHLAPSARNLVDLATRSPVDIEQARRAFDAMSAPERASALANHGCRHYQPYGDRWGLERSGGGNRSQRRLAA